MLTLAGALAFALANALWQAQAQWEVLGRARALMQARAEARARAEAEAEAQSLAVVTFGEVLSDSELIDIIYSIEPDLRHGLARVLWHQSRYWWLIQIITPITHLPPELPHQILLILVINASDSPLVLMRVSKHWYTIVTGIWASLKLGTATPRDVVTRKLERGLLDFCVYSSCIVCVLFVFCVY